MFPITDAAAMSSSHAGITSLLAGFAFAAFFLLLNPSTSIHVHGAARLHYQKAILMLAVGFTTGALTSYMYSAASSLPQRESLYLFPFPGTVFVIQVIALFSGVTMIIKALQLDWLFFPVRRVAFILIVMVYLLIWSTIARVVYEFECEVLVSKCTMPNHFNHWSIIAFSPIALALIILILHHTHTLTGQFAHIEAWYQAIREKTCASFGVAACISSILMTIPYIFWDMLNIESSGLRPQLSIMILLLWICSSFSAWAILLFPSANTKIQ